MEEATPAVKVTALIVSYNNAASVKRAIEALENSTIRKELEIIVVDCGSSDEGPTLDRIYPGVTVLRLERHFGSTRALNIGMRTAAGDYVFFLAPEVIVEPGTVAALAARLDADETIAAVCPLLIEPDGTPAVAVRKLPSPEGMPLLWRNSDQLPTTAVPADGDAVAVGYPGRRAVMARKQFIRAFNWFDDRYGDFGADLELAFQIRRAAKKIVVVPAIRVALTEPAPLYVSSAGAALLTADRAHGISVFLERHFGWFAAFKFRMSAILSSLARFDVRVLSGLVSDRKVDGTQSSL